MSNYCNYNASRKIGSTTNSPKIHEDDKVLVKNACGAQLANPLNITLNSPIEIATINLFLDKFKRPSVSIEVSGQLIFTATTAGEAISPFRLVRTCNGTRTVLSQNSTIVQTLTASGTNHNIFDIKFCDCNPCCDCAAYSIEYIPTTALTGTNASLTINNVCLQAIVTEAGPCTCNCNCCY